MKVENALEGLKNNLVLSLGEPCLATPSPGAFDFRGVGDGCHIPDWFWSAPLSCLLIAQS